MTLDPAKIVHEGQVFSGDTELTVKTDKFLVEEVTVAEEPALEGKAKVVYRGEIRFNYPVEPETLAPLVKLVDSEAPKPIGVKLEIDYRSKVVGYSTEPVQKKLLGENARRLYGIEPVLVVKERIDDFRPEILAW